jgi:dipeptidyl aminopeptidase/acylaminoacyl peptidase
VGIDLEALLSVPAYRALDVDAEGRILIQTDESGSMQLVELDPCGLATSLTALPGQCSGRYVPGRRAVLVFHDTDGNERSQISLLPLDRDADGPAGLDDLEPVVRDPAYVHNVADVTAAQLCYLTNRRNGVDFDIVVRDLASGVETVAYAGGGMVSTATLSPDGATVAFAQPGVPPLSDWLRLAEVGTGAVRDLTSRDEPAQHLRLSFTPDGAGVVAVTDRDRDHLGVALLDVRSGVWTWLAADDQWDVSGALSPDGRSLLTCANVDGVSVVQLRTSTGTVPVTLPGLGCVDGGQLPAPCWSPDGTAVAMSFTGPLTPGDALRVDGVSGAVRQLTDSGRDLAGLDLPAPETTRIPTPDGERVPCFVYRPAVSAAGSTVGSSVIHVHGGPESQARLHYNPVVTGLRQAGHTVVAPNVRGSTGYGKRWHSMDDVRLRLDSVADLAAIHAALPTLGLDPTRAALWGGSYGGYMVLAGLAFQPKLWAAGVDLVGMSSLTTFLENTSAYRRAVREREYGSLERDRDFLESASPLNRVADIRAPLFVIHGANDPRVPLSEAQQLAAAVAAAGVPCELVVFEDEGHGLSKRANRLAAYPRVFDFLAAHLGGEAM